MIENQSEVIDVCVKEYENKAKEEKLVKIKKYYDGKSRPLGDLEETIYKKIYNPKWENTTFTQKKYEDEITLAVSKTINDLKEIENLKSPFQKELVEVYYDILSVDKSKEKHEESMTVLKVMSQESNFVADINEKVEEAKLELKEDISSIDPIIKETSSKKYNNEYIIKFTASQKQLNQILDFMTIIRVDYEQC